MEMARNFHGFAKLLLTRNFYEKSSSTQMRLLLLTYFSLKIDQGNIKLQPHHDNGK